MCVGELLHPPDLPIRAHRPTAANTLNLQQAAGLDAGIKQPAIKSLLGHKILEEFTIKQRQQRDNRDRRKGIIFVSRLQKWNICTGKFIYIQPRSGINEKISYWCCINQKQNKSMTHSNAPCKQINIWLKWALQKTQLMSAAHRNIHRMFTQVPHRRVLYAPLFNYNGWRLKSIVLQRRESISVALLPPRST